MFSTVTSSDVKRPGVTVDALENRCAPARGYTLDFVAINADMGSHSVEKFRSHAVDTPTRAPTRVDKLKNRFRRLLNRQSTYDARSSETRCPRCDGLAWLPDYESLFCGACGWRKGDPTNEYRERRRQRGSVRTSEDRRVDQYMVLEKHQDENWDIRLSHYQRHYVADLKQLVDPKPKKREVMPKFTFNPFEEIAGGPVVGTQYQAPLMMSVAYPCELCGESFSQGDFFELLESGNLAHQLFESGDPSCDYLFDVVTGDAIGTKPPHIGRS